MGCALAHNESPNRQGNVAVETSPYALVLGTNAAPILLNPTTCLYSVHHVSQSGRNRRWQRWAEARGTAAQEQGRIGQVWWVLRLRDST